jgi:uncharacterized protein YjdB
VRWLSAWETTGGVPVTNVNSVMAGVTVDFTPIATYSDGLTEQVMYNTNIIGANGTWTSSNPPVGYVTQSGQFWAISQGTAIVHYTAPNGVGFSEWILYVTQGTE